MIKVTIEVAQCAGACYGVGRALDLAQSTAQVAQGEVHTLGPLIHNPLVVADLEQQGVLEAQTLDDIASGKVIIRSHGVVPQIIDEARERGLEVVDATCPYVKKVHLKARKLIEQGYQLVIVGESGHAEVEGIVGHAALAAQNPAEDIFVVCDAQQVADLPLKKRVGVVVQTTQSMARLQAIVNELLVRCEEVRVCNTICAATQQRQQAALELASRANCMIVIGGKNSGNTRRLVEICAQACSKTHHIESVDELCASWFADGDCIGITAGASTPQSHIDQCIEKIKSFD